MVSMKSAHLFPDNSPEAFNGFYCTWNPVKFRWKHFSCDDRANNFARGVYVIKAGERGVLRLCFKHIHLFLLFLVFPGKLPLCSKSE